MKEAAMRRLGPHPVADPRQNGIMGQDRVRDLRLVGAYGRGLASFREIKREMSDLMAALTAGALVGERERLLWAGVATIRQTGQEADLRCFFKARVVKNRKLLFEASAYRRQSRHLLVLPGSTNALSLT
jgi:hypothetical protein